MNWSNKYATYLAIDLSTNQMQSLTLNFKTFNFSDLPPITKLEKLNKLTLTHTHTSEKHEEIIDFNKISSFDKHIGELTINGTGAKKLILIGSFEKCTLCGIDNLETLDCTGLDLRNCYEVKAQLCKNNGPCIITETQKNYPSAFGKLKWKKETIPSTKEEIELYTASYNWDDGINFLNWAVKQSECDKGTALSIYWHGSPDYYTQFAKASDVDKSAKDGYSLLKRIEKRIKKDDFKSLSSE